MIQKNDFALFVFLLLAFFLFPVVASAKITDLRSYGPLKTRNQNPVYLQFLGLPIDTAQTLNKKQFAAEFTTTFSNVFEVRQTGTTQHNFDMELWRQSLTFKYGVTDFFEMQLEIPFITNGGGFLDGFLTWYHDLWGLPNAGRELTANNQFNFTLTQNGQTLINTNKILFGPTDMIVGAKYLIPKKLPFGFELALNPMIKLPTGRLTQGLSSGHFDFGTQFLLEKDVQRFHFVSQGGLVLVAAHTSLDPILKNYFVQFGQSAEFQILDGWSVIAQLTGHSSLFKNVDAPELKSLGLDLNVGFAGSFLLAHPYLDEFYYQFSFSEDITSTGPSVDFSVMFLAGLRF